MMSPKGEWDLLKCDVTFLVKWVTRGEGGVKNLKKWVTSFMNGLLLCMYIYTKINKSWLGSLQQASHYLISYFIQASLKYSTHWNIWNILCPWISRRENSNWCLLLTPWSSNSGQIPTTIHKSYTTDKWWGLKK